MRADPERLQCVYSQCTLTVQVYRVSEPEPERGSGPVVPGLASEPGKMAGTVRATQCHGCGGQRHSPVPVSVLSVPSSRTNIRELSWSQDTGVGGLVTSSQVSSVSAPGGRASVAVCCDQCEGHSAKYFLTAA